MTSSVEERVDATQGNTQFVQISTTTKPAVSQINIMIEAVQQNYMDCSSIDSCFASEALYETNNLLDMDESDRFDGFTYQPQPMKYQVRCRLSQIFVPLYSYPYAKRTTMLIQNLSEN
jgi:hypothetical protein